MHCLNKSSGEVSNSAVSSNVGDIPRAGDLFQDHQFVLRLQPRSKYSSDLGGKSGLKATFYVSQPFPLFHPMQKAGWWEWGSCLKNTGKAVSSGGKEALWIGTA